MHGYIHAQPSEEDRQEIDDVTREMLFAAKDGDTHAIIEKLSEGADAATVFWGDVSTC